MNEAERFESSEGDDRVQFEHDFRFFGKKIDIGENIKLGDQERSEAQQRKANHEVRFGSKNSIVGDEMLPIVLFENGKKVYEAIVSFEEAQKLSDKSERGGAWENIYADIAADAVDAKLQKNLKEELEKSADGGDDKEVDISQRTGISEKNKNEDDDGALVDLESVAEGMERVRQENVDDVDAEDSNGGSSTAQAVTPQATRANTQSDGGRAPTSPVAHASQATPLSTTRQGTKGGEITQIEDDKEIQGVDRFELEQEYAVGERILTITKITEKTNSNNGKKAHLFNFRVSGIEEELGCFWGKFTKITRNTQEGQGILQDIIDIKEKRKRSAQVASLKRGSGKSKVDMGGVDIDDAARDAEERRQDFQSGDADHIIQQRNRAPKMENPPIQQSEEMQSKKSEQDLSLSMMAQAQSEHPDQEVVDALNQKIRSEAESGEQITKEVKAREVSVEQGEHAQASPKEEGDAQSQGKELRKGESRKKVGNQYELTQSGEVLDNRGVEVLGPNDRQIVESEDSKKELQEALEQSKTALDNAREAWLHKKIELEKKQEGIIAKLGLASEKMPGNVREELEEERQSYENAKMAHMRNFLKVREERGTEVTARTAAAVAKYFTTKEFTEIEHVQTMINEDENPLRTKALKSIGGVVDRYRTFMGRVAKTGQKAFGVEEGGAGKRFAAGATAGVGFGVGAAWMTGPIGIAAMRMMGAASMYRGTKDWMDEKAQGEMQGRVQEGINQQQEMARDLSGENLQRFLENTVAVSGEKIDALRAERACAVVKNRWIGIGAATGVFFAGQAIGQTLQSQFGGESIENVRVNESLAATSSAESSADIEIKGEQREGGSEMAKEGFHGALRQEITGEVRNIADSGKGLSEAGSELIPGENSGKEITQSEVESSVLPTQAPASIPEDVDAYTERMETEVAGDSPRRDPESEALAQVMADLLEEGSRERGLDGELAQPNSSGESAQIDEVKGSVEQFQEGGRHMTNSLGAYEHSPSAPDEPLSHKTDVEGYRHVEEIETAMSANEIAAANAEHETYIQERNGITEDPVVVEPAEEALVQVEEPASSEKLEVQEHIVETVTIEKGGSLSEAVRQAMEAQIPEGSSQTVEWGDVLPVINAYAIQEFPEQAAEFPGEEWNVFNLVHPGDQIEISFDDNSVAQIESLSLQHDVTGAQQVLQESAIPENIESSGKGGDIVDYATQAEALHREQVIFSEKLNVMSWSEIQVHTKELIAERGAFSIPHVITDGLSSFDAKLMAENNLLSQSIDEDYVQEFLGYARSVIGDAPVESIVKSEDLNMTVRSMVIYIAALAESSGKYEELFRGRSA